METRPFGTKGLRASAIGQGTWNMERDDRSLAVAALRRGLDLGLTHIDTAELYGHGRVEELVGEAIAGRRAEVFLVSKVIPQNATRDGVIAACGASPRRLRTDVLDSYLLHWPGPHPLEDTFAGFDALLRAGKIRSFGVSNFDEVELQAATTIGVPAAVACNQVLYHLGERAIEHAVIPACHDRGVTVVAYSPFGSGDFPQAHPILADVAASHGASPRQVALAFLLRNPATLVIPKAARAAHVEDNAGAASLRLAPEEVARLDAVFPRRPRQAGVPTL